MQGDCEFTMTIQCCVCHKIRDEHGWKAAPAAASSDSSATSHGYCPKCLKEAYKQIRTGRYRARYRGLVPKPL